MKIELSEYFKSLGFKTGYLVKDKKGRMDIHLIKELKRGGKRKCIAYAKYLWMSFNKKDVPEGYQVDHINNDFTDDRIENLQILSQLDNIQKSKKEAEMVSLVCPVCGKTFKMPKRNMPFKNNPTCSRRCGGIKSHWYKNK
jgi:hypothetical protein